MKKILSLILSAMLVLSIAGCSSTGSKQDTKEVAKQGDGGEKLVGVCMPEK